MKTYHIDKWFRQTFGRINNLNWTCWMICLWTLMLHPLHVCAYLSQVHHSNSKPRLFNLDYNHANQLIISSQVIFSFFPEHSPNYCHLYPIQTRKSVRLVGVLLFRSPSTFIILPVTASFILYFPLYQVKKKLVAIPRILQHPTWFFNHIVIVKKNSICTSSSGHL
jgi:hypothetical protein